MSVRCDNPAAAKRYLLRIVIAMALYLGSLAGAKYMIDVRGFSGPMAFAFAAIPGLCFAAVIWIFGALIIEERDEFFRLLYIRQALIATGLSFTGAAIWGYFEQFQLVPHVTAYWWPLLWCFGIGVGAVFNKVKYGTFGEIR